MVPQFNIPPAVSRPFQSYFRNLQHRSRAIPILLQRHIASIAILWLLLMSAVMVLRVRLASVPVHNLGDLAELALPYVLIMLAPVAGYRLASASFPRGQVFAQPEVRFARLGRWKSIDAIDARSDPAFGPSGFMASLLVGLLLNVAMRAGEFALAIPAINSHAPGWATQLFHLMALDLGLMGFLYMVCFVAALRAVPLFPRLLVFAWLCDLALQLGMAANLSAAQDLPSAVAMPLSDLLVGNVYKVMISVAVWLPYLLLSQRVNLTYRLRVARNAPA